MPTSDERASSGASELLPVVPAVDILLANVLHQLGEMDEQELADAVAMELAGVDDLTDLVKALGVMGAATASTLATFIPDITAAGVLRNFKNALLEDIHGSEEG